MDSNYQQEPVDEEQSIRRAKASAAGLAPDTPDEAADRAARALANLDSVFQKAARRIPVEELMWDGPDVGPGSCDEIVVEPNRGADHLDADEAER